MPLIATVQMPDAFLAPCACSTLSHPTAGGGQRALLFPRRLTLNNLASSFRCSLCFSLRHPPPWLLTFLLLVYAASESVLFFSLLCHTRSNAEGWLFSMLSDVFTFPSGSRFACALFSLAHLAFVVNLSVCADLFPRISSFLNLTTFILTQLFIPHFSVDLSLFLAVGFFCAPSLADLLHSRSLSHLSLRPSSIFRPAKHSPETLPTMFHQPASNSTISPRFHLSSSLSFPRPFPSYLRSLFIALICTLVCFFSGESLPFFLLPLL